MKLTFNYVPVASSLSSHVDVERVIADLAPGLEKIGGTRGDVASVEQPDPLVFLVVSGGTERQILRLRESRIRCFGAEPTLLLTHPDRNSLPAALEVLAKLRQDGAVGRIFACSGHDDIWSYEQVRHAVEDVAVWRSMHDLRLGLVGEPSDWLVASAPTPEVVREVWGPEIVRSSTADFSERIEEVEPADVELARRALVRGATRIHEPGTDELTSALQVSLALQRLVRSERLGAVAVRCFDLLTTHRTTGCLALADLNDLGIVAGCEGDLPATLTMLWLGLLTGDRTWMANPARIETSANQIVLAHCTIARSLVGDTELRSHFESGIGVAVQGKLAPGPVTLARIGGRNLEQVWLAEGQTVESEIEEALCRTQVRIALDYGHVRDLLAKPLGNHLVLVRGRHLGRLRSWHETMLPQIGSKSSYLGVVNTPIRSSRYPGAIPEGASRPPSAISPSRPSES